MALDPISTVANLVGGIIDKIWPDKNIAEQAKQKMAELAMTGQLEELKLLASQIDVNKTEAASSSVFVAGWRPFVGWVCGAGFAWQFVVGPFFYWIVSALGKNVPLLALDYSELTTLLLGLLGLAGMRSYDKKQITNNGGSK